MTQRPKTRECGMSLIELVSVVTILIVLASTLGYTVLALTRGSQSVTATYLMQSQWQNAKRRITLDLKGSDAVSVDEFGNPLVQVIDVSGTPHLELRTISHYTIDQATDQAVPVYGPTTDYWLQNSTLLRELNGVQDTIATNVVDAAYSVSPEGLVTVSLSHASPADGGAPILQQFRVRPNNNR